jgi:hypothetical protein
LIYCWTFVVWFSSSAVVVVVVRTLEKEAEGKRWAQRMAARGHVRLLVF